MTLGLGHWDARFLDLANYVGRTWSKDPRTRVGAVARGAGKHQVAIGFNGLAPGIRDDDRLLDRPWKLARVIHAEENALANATFQVECVYCNFCPCLRCAHRIIAHRVQRVVAPAPTGEFLKNYGDEIMAARQDLCEAGVIVDLIAPEDLPWSS
jgi:dCMP deaminase